MIIIEESVSLKSYNTFRINAFTRFFAEANTLPDLRTIIDVFRGNPLPKLILGGGSNLLFTRNFEGIVIFPDIRGREIIKEDDKNVWVKAFAGENWDEFVAFCVEQKWYGIENLSYIPGNVGASPIQNIGAYGVEVKDAIDSVEAWDIETGQTRTFNNPECKFGYRDSIFKNELRNKYLILSVTFKLSKKPVYNISYKDLQEELKYYSSTDIVKIREAIIKIRQRKLPDPKELGNAGSFFKNPVVFKQDFYKIKEKYPDITCFPIDNDTVKIPAAWLIQTCGWKGKREGMTGTHPNQPLVIVNYGEATGSEIVQFARNIQQSVFEKFSVNLEMEVRVI